MGSHQWKEIPTQDQEALLEWYNIRKRDMDYRDYRNLTDLYFQGRFEWWRCPACKKRVMKGNPSNWDNFQGVCQVDYTSYPGNRDKYSEAYLLKLCDTHRMES